MAATLASMGVKHMLEALTADDLFSVDIGVHDGPDGALSAAIEVDGPHHFTVNGCMPLGRSSACQWITARATDSISTCSRALRFDPDCVGVCVLDTASRL